MQQVIILRTGKKFLIKEKNNMQRTPNLEKKQKRITEKNIIPIRITTKGLGWQPLTDIIKTKSTARILLKEQLSEIDYEGNC